MSALCGEVHKHYKNDILHNIDKIVVHGERKQ